MEEQIRKTRRTLAILVKLRSLRLRFSWKKIKITANPEKAVLNTNYLKNSHYSWCMYILLIVSYHGLALGNNDHRLISGKEVSSPSSSFCQVNASSPSMSNSPFISKGSWLASSFTYLVMSLRRSSRSFSSFDFYIDFSSFLSTFD